MNQKKNRNTFKVYQIIQGSTVIHTGYAKSSLSEILVNYQSRHQLQNETLDIKLIQEFPLTQMKEALSCYQNLKNKKATESIEELYSSLSKDVENFTDNVIQKIKEKMSQY